jgi:hypothetical protein
MGHRLVKRLIGIIVENYLYDDPKLDDESLLVSSDAKKKIKKWMKDMGLDRSPRRPHTNV